ncbi:electron transport complex subunit RsxC [Alteromonadaceae bacterium BrNp21-10]|nr:electron transport complex subunit RsxC [Alteromonadaceae bacterium BrNp21-10]
MKSIIDRIRQGRLWGFPGGIHPPARKSLSNQSSIEELPLPERLYISVKQHIGVAGRVCVEEGQSVLKGQALTRSANPFAVPVHAPTSGIIAGVINHPSAHPSALPEKAIELIPDGKGQWAELSPLPNYTAVAKSKLIETICAAGVAGMGGAGFPTHIKASPKKDIEFLIINGVECEPYITADDRLMREYAWHIRQGIDVLCHLLSPEYVVIAIEDNKPEAIEAMKVACNDVEQYVVSAIPTQYPAGGEKQLIQTLTGKEVPKNGLPSDVGIVMHNVGTCYAVADAVFNGKPLIQRVVTVTGESLQQPKNVWAAIGTPVSHLLSECGYDSAKQSQPNIIMGGPMMGFALADDSIPVVKITNCILAPSAEEIPANPVEQACIRCGACADACPVSLLPQQLYWYSKANDFEKANEYNLFDCIECGACAYVCPSDIPLVHYYRTTKADIRAEEEEKHLADKARQRFEARNERLIRDQHERDEKHRKAAEARKQSMQSDGGSAKDKIAAALARAKAKKQASADESANQSANVTTAPPAENSTTETASISPTAPAADDKKQKVAAAIARAKAKKLANAAAADKPSTDAGEDNAASPKPVATDAVTENADVTPDNNIAESTDTTSDDKKQRVAQAVARAKAKRAERQQADNNNADTDNEDAGETQKVETQELDKDAIKKQRVAAAIAKAKARKLAQQNQDNENNS